MLGGSLLLSSAVEEARSVAQTIAGGALRVTPWRTKPEAQKRRPRARCESFIEEAAFGDSMQGYRYEFELREPVVRWLTEVKGCDVVADELTLGGGYPDLIATTIDRLDEREQQALDPVVAVNDFVRLFAEPGLVPIDAFGGLIAVELKLRDWRKAIGQACRYRTFASESYIAIPMERATDDVLQTASESGVGVIGISNDARVILPARSGCPHDPVQKGWASELVLAQFLGHRPACRLAGTPSGNVVPVG